MMEEITRNRAFSGDLRMLQPTRGLVLRIPWQVVPGAFAIRNGGRVWNGYLWVLRFKPRNSKRFCRVPTRSILLQSQHDWTPFTQWSWDELRCRPTKITLHDSIGTRTISVRVGSWRTLPAAGEFSGAVSKKNGNPKFNSLSWRFPHQKRVSVYTVFEDKPILAAGRLALYLGFWGAFVFVL